MAAFNELDVYRRACDLADDLYKVCSEWPKFQKWSLGIQLMRAADSVGANIAEATGRWHAPDRRRFLFIARGSLSETEHWILCAERRGLLSAGWSERLSEVRRPLNGLIKRNPPR